MQHQPINTNLLAQQAHAELVIESHKPHDPIQSLCKSLAYAWVHGEQVGVRRVIKKSTSLADRIRIKNGVRELLPNDALKDAFDLYMRGY